MKNAVGFWYFESLIFEMGVSNYRELMHTKAFLESFIILPKKPAIGSVIWLHGLGADGYDCADIVSKLCLPDSLHLRFLFPHAPIRPVMINANMHMRAWYDIYSLENSSQEDACGIVQMQQSIHQLIEQEISSGIPSNRIVLAGFSQGGAMSLYTGLHCQKPLAGIVVLSAYLPLANRLSKEVNIINQSTPIFIAHGDIDSVLPIILGRNTAYLLKELGYDAVTWREYPIQHQICKEEIEEISKWLNNLFLNNP